MSRLDQFYGQIPKQPSLDSFVICPESFIQGKSAKELAAMQQIYKSAYKKALKDINSKSSDNFDMGAGI